MRVKEIEELGGAATRRAERLRGWKGRSQCVDQACNCGRRHRPTPIEFPGEGTPVVQAVPANLGTAEQWQVGFGEAEHAHDRDVGVAEAVERLANRHHLTVEPVGELTAIAALDEELRGAEQRSRDADLAADVLRVDHVDTGRRDRKVVDVPAAVRHATIVQEDRIALGGAALERPCDRSLADGSTQER
ncbi:MAG TPA: hypothetical protein VGO29_09510 [Solirubrobacteraceae bacterium]|nr:hypothetical protein [Solirubrobacteraceae bacterium]